GSENAAKKRVSRALEKLRTFFIKRGVTLSTVAIAASIAENCVQAAPSGLAASIAATTTKGTAVGTSTLTLAKTTVKIMNWMQFKLTAGIGVAALLLGSASIVGISSAVRAKSDERAARSFVGFSGHRRFVPLDLSQNLNAKLA